MIQSLRSAVAAAILAAGFAAAPAMAANIVETAQGAGQFTTLLAAAKAAGLADALATSDPLTVFAPSDAAFRKLPAGTVETLLRPENREQLRAILAYHVVPARIAAKDVPHQPTQVATLNPDNKVRAVRRNGRVHIDKARVVKADIRADNGIIHVIDRVLMPSRR